MERTKCIRSFSIGIILLVLSFLCADGVYASTNGHSQAEAVAWARNMADSHTYCGECVALIQKYYAWLGASVPNTNANTYANQDHIPPGWHVDNTPSLGAVYVESNYSPGHVSIVVGIDSAGTLTTVDSNVTNSSVPQYNAQYFPWTTGRKRSDYAGVPGKWFVHPDFIRAKGTLNVDGILDGKAVGNTDYYGNFHVYINGQRITTEPVSDFWHQGLNAGDTYEIRDINPDPGKVYSGGTNLSGTIVANSTQTAVIRFDTAKGTLNVDGILDGKAVGNTDYYGNFHVYINGQRITTEPVSDFWHQGLNAGDTYEIRDINPDPGKVYSGGTNLSGTITANDTQTAVVHFDTAKAPMDVNFTVNGKDTSKLTGIGTIQVYVDGELQTTNGATSYVDFCQHVFVGKSYEVRVNITNSDYRFIGVDTSELGYTGQTGTTGNNNTFVRLVFCKMATMDVNFTVDGKDTSKLTGIGNIQVYVGGELQKTLDATSYVDFCQHVLVAQPYEVKLNITNANYKFVGVDTSGSGYTGQTGTTGENGTLVRLVIETVQSSGCNEPSTGGVSQTGGIQPSTGGKTSGDGQTTTKNQPAAGSQQAPTKKENITINKVPASVKTKAKKNKVTVSWKKLKKTNKVYSKVKSIQVQYSTDPKFETNSVTKKVAKSKTKLVLKLKKKKTYFIRVRYVGKNGVSKWTKAKRVKTK